jgi:twinkle protein
LKTMFIKELQDLGIDIKGNATGDIKTQCPKCNHNRKNKRDVPLSVNPEKGIYNCHHCGWSGTVKFKPKQEYIKPPEVEVNLGANVINWFKSRGISEPTLAHWKIGESVEWMPQTGTKRNTINFNYYRNKELVNVKYRDAEKNFKLVSGAELIFYGLDNIKELDTVYIVEGEMDALSLHEAGIYSVCSVPNGASKGNQRLEYLDNCWESFKDKTEIVLCTDNDSPGLALRKELARRFGAYRCKYVNFGDFKDANEVLCNQGPEALRKLVRSAKNFPLEGVLDVSSIWNSVLNYNENGIKNYSIGLGGSDDYFKLAFGEWTVLTGIPNSGKSDIIDQICVNMALRYGFRTAMFAPESFPYEGHIKRIANKLNERNCNNDQLNQTKDFIEEHFYWVKIDLDNLTLQAILDHFRQLVFQKGVNLLVIDPWNMLDHSAQRDHSYIGVILSKITEFCQQTNTHLFLVAHPKKLEKNQGKYAVPGLYDISGSADFYNKCYNGIVCYRHVGVRTSIGSDLVEVFVEKVKRKENGGLGSFEIAPDFNNGGIYEPANENDKIFDAVPKPEPAPKIDIKHLENDLKKIPF